jgi:hypothetical protein
VQRRLQSQWSECGFEQGCGQVERPQGHVRNFFPAADRCADGGHHVVRRDLLGAGQHHCLLVSSGGHARSEQAARQVIDIDQLVQILPITDDREAALFDSLE